MTVWRLVTAKPSVLIALPILLAAAAGAVYASWSGLAGSANEETSTGSVPVSNDSARLALASASDRVGFEPLVPTFLPTGANEIVLIDASTGPPGTTHGSRRIELVYRSAEPEQIDRAAAYSTLEMFQTNVRLSGANGEPFASDLAGYEVHRDVVSTDRDGDPVKVTYTARAAARTLVMDFTGDQPTEDGLRQMLESLKLFEP